MAAWWAFTFLVCTLALVFVVDLLPVCFLTKVGILFLSVANATAGFFVFLYLDDILKGER